MENVLYGQCKGRALSMTLYYPLILLTIFLSGCTKPGLEFIKEPLTGDEYCYINPKLLPGKNCDAGSLVLKCPRIVGMSKKAAIKATLNIAHNNRRDYHSNPDEILVLVIDGLRYNLEIINSLKKPLEEVQRHNVALPSGGNFGFGTVNEVTRRKIAFFLSDEILTKASAAKKAHFEITLQTIGKSQIVPDYPIVLMLGSDSLALINDFKNKCIYNPASNQE
jgi:hypothetical protein